MPKTEVNKRRLDAEGFIRRTMEWPMWPFLPLKRVVTNGRGRMEQECGLIVDSKDAPHTVYVTDLFGLKELKESGKWLPDVPQHKYASLTELLDDGWVVD